MGEDTLKILKIIGEISLTILLLIGGFAINTGSYKRGFICNDPSLSFPYQEHETFNITVTAILCAVFPQCVIAGIELFKHFHQRKVNRKSYSIFDKPIPSAVINLYIYFGIYLLGFGITVWFTNVAKETVLSLRPHFFDICQPIMPGNTTCNDAVNHNRFITDYECSRHGSLRDIIDYCKSFPSGHSSYLFFGMTWLVVYIETKWKTQDLRIYKVTSQFGLLLLAWFVAMSRIRDHYHRLVDVIAGSIIGITVALVVTKLVYKEHFCRKQKKSDETKNQIDPYG